MADSVLSKSVQGNNIEILLAGELQIESVPSPIPGGVEFKSSTYDTGIKGSDGFILFSSIKFDGDDNVYNMPYIETESSGSTGANMKWFCYTVSQENTTTGTVEVSSTVLNYDTDEVLPASKVNFYVLRTVSRGNQ